LFTKFSGKQKILLTGGRAPVTLELARSFNRAGFQVYVAESLFNHLCRFSAKVKRNFAVPQPNRDAEGYRDALIKIMNSMEINWLIPTCEEVFQIARWKPEIESSCPGKIYCSDFNTLIRLHNKYTFIQQAASHGFKVPRTFLVSSMGELLRYYRELGVPSVVKPIFSRFGTKVKYLPEQLEQVLEIEISPRKQWVLQQRIFGEQYCTYSIIHQGRLTAHATYRMGFKLNSGASISFEAVHHPAVVDFVRRFSKTEQFTGQIAFDLIEDSYGDLYPIECNPRTTSGIHLLARNPLLPEVFFEPAGSPIVPRPGVKAMLLFPMLYSGIKLMSDPNTLKRWFATLRASQDVIWDRSDPIPFFQQLTIPLSLWWISRKNKLSLTEASTLDIEWNGEP
jgi:hypothetical protein